MKKMLVALLMVLVLLTGMCSFAFADSSAEPITIRMTWWGGNSRNDMMNQVLDYYEEMHPGVTVTREYTSWNDYWPKLATQAATGTAPDVVPYTMMTLSEYADKDLLLPLEDLVASGDLDMSGFSQSAIDAGTYNDHLYAVLYGMTVNTILYNATLIQEVGMDLPPETWTMDQFKDYCLELRSKLPDDVYVMETDGGYDHAIEAYARSIGKSLYNAEGTGFGFDKQDLITYWTWWNELRAANVTPPPQNVAEAAGLSYEESYIVNGKSAMMNQNGNFIQTYNNVSKYDIRITTTPRATIDASGDFLQPTEFAIMKSSKIPEAAADLIEFICNDATALKMFKGDLGMPGNVEGAKAVLEVVEKPTKDFYGFVEQSILPYVKPVDFRVEGSSEVLTAFKLKYEQVANGEKDIETAVDEIFAEAEEILAD